MAEPSLEGCRSVLSGVLWVLRTGAPLFGPPDRYPSFQPVTGAFSNGVRWQGTIHKRAYSPRRTGRPLGSGQ